jgi:AAA+ ATPase superfamily predicted ATPase
MEELKVPNRYMDILTAISLGKNTLSEIADFTKINRENLTTYLETLKSMKIISRELPVLAKTRRSQYVILDPFFEFWFRFVKPNKTALEAGLERKVWINIKEEFNTYLGKIFQKIAEEYITDEVKSGNIDLEANIIGRWWSRNEEIDIIAYSSKRREGILFEVKWKDLSYNDVKNNSRTYREDYGGGIHNKRFKRYISR